MTDNPKQEKQATCKNCGDPIEPCTCGKKEIIVDGKKTRCNGWIHVNAYHLCGYQDCKHVSEPSLPPEPPPPDKETRMFPADVASEKPQEQRCAICDMKIFRFDGAYWAHSSTGLRYSAVPKPHDAELAAVGNPQPSPKLDDVLKAPASNEQPPSPHGSPAQAEEDVLPLRYVNGRFEPWPDSGNYSDPTPEMLADPIWNAIWEEIKHWDINVPSRYAGYTGATGNHATAIFKAISQKAPVKGEYSPGDECEHEFDSYGSMGEECRKCGLVRPPDPCRPLAAPAPLPEPAPWLDSAIKDTEAGYATLPDWKKNRPAAPQGAQEREELVKQREDRMRALQEIFDKHQNTPRTPKDDLWVLIQNHAYPNQHVTANFGSLLEEIWDWHVSQLAAAQNDARTFALRCGVQSQRADRAESELANTRGKLNDSRQETVDRVADLTAANERIREMISSLAECYRLSGADPDGNEDWRLATSAVVEVARLRQESDKENERLTAELDSALLEAKGLREAHQLLTLLVNTLDLVHYHGPGIAVELAACRKWLEANPQSPTQSQKDSLES